MSSRPGAGRRPKSELSIPQFEPLPNDSFLNRIINKLLAPLFYLIFTIITAIVVVPIYTIIENFKQGRNSRGGRRVPKNEDPNKPETSNQAMDFLKGYSSSYGGAAKQRHQHHHHHHHHHEQEQDQDRKQEQEPQPQSQPRRQSAYMQTTS